MKILTKFRKEISEDSFLKIAQIIIGTFTVELLLSTLLFFIGLSITWYFFFVSLAISIVICNIINDGSVSVIEIIASIAIIVAFSWFSGKIFDVSWDGNSYHKLAIGLLKNHWNPLKSLPSLELTEGAGVYSFGNTLWVETYCKSTWFWGASIYAITGNIETGKSYTMIAMLCAFFVVFYFMRKKEHNIFRSVVMASIAAFNPIAVQQMTSFYIDGFLHTMLIILVVSLLMLEDKDHFDSISAASMVASSMIVCGNIKFTGLLYGGIFCIVYYLIDCYRFIRRDSEWVAKVLKESALYCCLAIATVVWAGCSVYLTNFIRHGSLTYPLTGEGKVDIMTANSPFADENHFKNLFLSLFSRVDIFTIASGKSPELKIPFTFNMNEVSMMDLPDSRISGFGILFSGLLVVAIICLVFCFAVGNNRQQKIIIAVNLIVCVALMFCIKESWWARYSPYIYFIILAAVYMMLCSKKKITMFFVTMYCTMLLANNCTSLINFKFRFENAKAIEAEFLELKNAGMIEICNREFEGVYFNFKDYNVFYRVNNDLVNEEGLNTTNYKGTVWRLFQNQ